MDRDYDGIDDGEPTEFEWNIFPGFTTLQLCGKVSDPLSDLGQTPETFTGRILFMSMFNDISSDRKDNKEECLANAGVVKVLAKKFGIGQWSFIGAGSEKKWYSAENSPQGAWDHIAEKMLLEFAESGVLFSVQPLHCPGEISKARDMENCQYTSLQTIQQLEQFFALLFLSISSVSTEQLRTYVRNLRTIKMDQGESEILMVQSNVLGEKKAEILLQNENYSNHQIFWQQYMERIESLSPESKVSRFCMEAGFMRVVEVGQYFMTKDTGDFRQFRSVACREHTLSRDDPASQPKGWIQGDQFHARKTWN